MINQKGLTLLESWKEVTQSLLAVESQSRRSFLKTHFVLGYEDEND